MGNCIRIFNLSLYRNKSFPLLPFFFPSLLAVPVAYGSSWARDQIGAGVMTYITVTAMLDP